MIEKDLVQIEDKILAILKDHEKARNNDKVLWLLYNINYNGLEMFFSDAAIIEFYKWLMSDDVPMFESISRLRRKVQKENPELLGDKAGRDKLAEKVKEILQ